MQYPLETELIFFTYDGLVLIYSEVFFNAKNTIEN